MRRFLIYIVLISLSNNLFGQGYTTPSPDAIGLAKIANMPTVNYYSGAAVVNIPVAQIGGNELTVPLTLTYNGSGHKVQEIASAVGLGFNLQAGGVITRVVRHLPDDLAYGFCKVNPYDTEPDLYFYNFLGQSGKFILDNYGNAITIPYRNIVIKPGVCTPNSNGAWEIIDENGTIYKFGTNSWERETTTVKEKSGTITSFTTTWFLTEVSSPNKTEKIQFYYTSAQFSIVNPYFTRTKDGCHNDVVKDLSTTITTNTRFVSSIVSPLGTATLTWQANRKDLQGRVSLSSIQINNSQNQQIAKLRFEYSYFQSDEGCTASDCFRLRLDKIFDLAPDPVYTFGYNTSVNLPRRNSKNFDRWGFYNNNTVDSWFTQITSLDDGYFRKYSGSWPTSINFPGASREPDLLRSLANLLTSIEQRGSGMTEFSFEPHYVNEAGSNELVGGARVQSIKLKDGEGNSYIRSFKYVDESNPALSSGRIFTKPKYVLGFFNNGNLTEYIISSHSFKDIFDLNGSYIGYSRVEEEVSGIGKTVYYFKNYDSNPDYIDSNGVKHDYSWQRGLVYNVKVFDLQNNPVTEQQTDYNFDQPNKRKLNYNHLMPWPSDCQTDKYLKFAMVSRPLTITKQTNHVFDSSVPSKKSTEITEFGYDIGPVQLTTTTRYDFNKPSIKYIVRNKYVTHSDYLGSYDDCYTDFEDCNLSCQNEPDPQVQGYCYSSCSTQYDNCINSPPSNLDPNSLALYYLRNKHQVATPVETTSLYQEGSSVKVLASSLNIFEMGGISGNHILLKESWGFKQIIDEGSFNYSQVHANGNFQKDHRMKKLRTFDLYDQTSGNLQKQTTLNGIVTTYNWEPNNKYIQSITTNPGDNARTTSYTHKPLVGPASVMDANGIGMQYEYDVYNRLKIVKDQDGNILRRYRYHYKNETPGFRITSNRTEAFTNESFTFYATDVAVSSGGPPKYKWDFGDGTITDNANTTIQHTYSTQGQYSVKLYVTNPEYGEVMRSMQVGVYAPMSLNICVDGPAYIDFCGIEPTYYGGCTVNNTYPYSPTELTVLVTNGCPSSYSYYWEYRNLNFGYWTSLGTSQSATFYPSMYEGTYEIRCTVTDGCYDQKVTSTYVYVYKSNPECQGGIQY